MKPSSPLFKALGRTADERNRRLKALDLPEWTGKNPDSGWCAYVPEWIEWAWPQLGETAKIVAYLCGDFNRSIAAVSDYARELVDVIDRLVELVRSRDGHKLQPTEIEEIIALDGQIEGLRIAAGLRMLHPSPQIANAEPWNAPVGYTKLTQIHDLYAKHDDWGTARVLELHPEWVHRMQSLRQSALTIAGHPDAEFMDGPSDRLWFIWKGKRYRVPGQRLHLLKLLWNAPGRSMEREAVCESIWGEDWDKNTLSTTMNRLNNDLVETGWSVRQVDGILKLGRQGGSVTPPITIL